MSLEQMTLLERLLNPQWVCGQGITTLDSEQTIADMREAADVLQGEGVLRKSLINEIRRLSDALAEGNQMLRSAYQVAARSGAETGWETFRNQLFAVLEKQHAILHPKSED